MLHRIDDEYEKHTAVDVSVGVRFHAVTWDVDVRYLDNIFYKLTHTFMNADLDVRITMIYKLLYS